MKHAALGDMSTIVARLRETYADDRAALEVLDACERRLREPLRIGIAGMVKAGKSTLLNALIGERIAPTDAGECTRTVTWYRHGPTARVTVHLRDGSTERMPVRRSQGHLALDLGDLRADEVEWIDVEWPSESLRSIVLIDTPGIASLSADVSARTISFLTPSRAPSAADAIIYLLRHVHASDVKFLEEFHDTAAGASQTVNALAVLSRADEIGSGRIDSLLSAAKIAERYRRDGELRSLALGVIPVAGLLAEGARTLRQSEFAAFQTLAGLDRALRTRALISVDRFLGGTAEIPLSVAQRRDLLARFGVFGVRLATALVRAGARTSTELAERLVQQSGLIEVQNFVTEQFRARASSLKTRGVAHTLETLVRERRRPDAAGLLPEIERLALGTHDLRELALLADLRTGTPDLSADDILEAERIVGGAGTSTVERLGLTEGADRRAVRERIDQLLTRWRGIAESPLSERATIEICRTVTRSVEGVASELPTRRAAAAAAAVADVVTTGGPAQRRR
ncbi:dynamin family protein [Microbacterium sulfonylureivorans]|uniref:dynamin family protein n=1 Tax=Microbacterium sulfonylureivorans TaxID=2486854 RepID=UPI001F0B8B25|nr:dynamin family protein [Microbacterium sulfonylureivorans]